MLLAKVKKIFNAASTILWEDYRKKYIKWKIFKIKESKFHFKEVRFKELKNNNEQTLLIEKLN